MLHRILALLFPPKCTLCRKLLDKDETDLCRCCRTEAPEITKPNFKLQFLAGWTAVWYYKDDVRKSLLRYKFYNARSYADVYGRILAMKLQKEHSGDFDLLTWVPISTLRRWKRGFDQVELIALAVGRELGIEPVPTLKKIRNTPPQSGIRDSAKRRANVLGAYRVIDPATIAGKRLLMLDDIITTGATASECGKTLLTAGAKEVFCAAVAAASHDKK